MARLVRENALSAFMAAAACAALAWLGLYGYAWNDYDDEARGAIDALTQGHLSEFFHLAPAYGGSLLERAPFALLPGLWGGGDLAIYRMLALPCLLAAAVLGVCLTARMRAEGRSQMARAVALAVCVANPITLRALEIGHPEELMGACLCVAAVLLAGRSARGASALWCGILLGLAIANKQWALLAAGPVLLALPAKRGLQCLASAGATAAAVLAPLALASSGAFAASTRAVAAPGSAIFQPWQLWWFLGHHGALVHGTFGAPKPGYRIGPRWAGEVSHPLIIAVGVALTVLLWLLRRHARSSRPVTPRPAPLSAQEALLALALLLLLRCLLDTWNNIYYMLPFVLALLAWEVGRPKRQPPVLALSCTVLVWASFQWLPQLVSADAQAALFLLWTLPLAAWLGRGLFFPAGAELQRRSRAGESARTQETTVSLLGKLVRTS
jgi:hypothetical protein